jgi:hypothetical protein
MRVITETLKPRGPLPEFERFTQGRVAMQGKGLSPPRPGEVFGASGESDRWIVSRSAAG